MCYLFYFVVVNRTRTNILKPKSIKKGKIQTNKAKQLTVRANLPSLLTEIVSILIEEFRVD